MNDFSPKLKGSQRGWRVNNHEDITIPLIIFADNMQFKLYFNSRNQMIQGAEAFITHLKLWGLKVYVAELIDGKSKSKAKLCPAVRRIEITNDGTKHECN